MTTRPQRFGHRYLAASTLVGVVDRGGRGRSTGNRARLVERGVRLFAIQRHPKDPLKPDRRDGLASISSHRHPSRSMAIPQATWVGQVGQHPPKKDTQQDRAPTAAMIWSGHARSPCRWQWARPAVDSIGAKRRLPRFNGRGRRRETGPAGGDAQDGGCPGQRSVHVGPQSGMANTTGILADWVPDEAEKRRVPVDPRYFSTAERHPRGSSAVAGPAAKTLRTRMFLRRLRHASACGRIAAAWPG